MSLTTLIDKIMGKQQEREKARTADFQTIVRQIVTGKEPDPDRVDAVLADAGKSLDDLREAVERLQARRRLREQLDQLPKLAAERQQVEKEIEAADNALTDAEQKHAEMTAPLHARLVQVREGSWAAESAKTQLVQTCTDPALLAQMRDVESQLTQARKEVSDLRNTISDYRDRARNEHAAAEQAQRIVHGEQQVQEHQERAKRHERTADGCQAQLLRAEKAVATLERQERAIRDQMLVP